MAQTNGKWLEDGRFGDGLDATECPTAEQRRHGRITDAVYAFGGDAFDAWDAVVEADAARAVRS